MGVSIHVEILIICLVCGSTDRQGFHAGWDHRLCEVPTSPSQSEIPFYFFNILLGNLQNTVFT